MYDTRKLSKVYDDFKTNTINIQIEKQYLVELFEIKDDIEKKIKNLEDENDKLRINIEKLNITIDKKNDTIDDYDKYLSEYAEKHGNPIDRILYYAERIPILGQVVYIFIGFPYLILQLVTGPFNMSKYNTNEQKSKRKELRYVLKEPSKEVSENKQLMDHNLAYIDKLQNTLLKLSYLISIKEYTISRSSAYNEKHIKLYYIRLKDNNRYFYKIGITKYNVFTRYSQDTKNMNIDKIIFEINCDKAEHIEQAIIELNRAYRLHKLAGRYFSPESGEELLDSGNSEIFTEDILSINFFKKENYENTSILKYKDENFDEQMDFILNLPR